MKDRDILFARFWLHIRTTCYVLDSQQSLSRILTLSLLHNTKNRTSTNSRLRIIFVCINFWLQEELDIGNSAWLQIGSSVDMGMCVRWSCNRNQVLNFQHSASSNCHLASSIIFDDTTRYVWSCCLKKLVLVPITSRKIKVVYRQHYARGAFNCDVLNLLPVRNLTITMECGQQIGICIVQEVNLRERERVKAANKSLRYGCPLLKEITTCKSPWPSPLNVTEGGVVWRIIWMLDPGHSRSSIASFSAADWWLIDTKLTFN